MEKVERSLTFDYYSLGMFRWGRKTAQCPTEAAQ